ncbi:MAG: amidohydrolase family protein [Verrucomicrobiae bacterium]|nr:amidohydrolase family protein [Verrucomicrobiae bacterium]
MNWILRARTLAPLGRPPLDDAALVISGERITALGRWRNIRRVHTGPVTDLGEVLLLPGLINAHCHLDYTHMAGLFPPPKNFCDWIKSITFEKSLWSAEEFAASWRDGAGMLLRNGTTTVADVETVPALLPDLWHATPLRVFSFLEMTGVRSRRDPGAILRETAAKILSLPCDPRCRAGLSPHAPYSTTPALLRESARLARRHRWRLVTHIAESAPEFEMFRHARGDMFDWLRRNERDMADCDGVSPVQHAERCRLLGPNLLAIHVNYLAPGDAALLARRRVHVVHCPRSHDYFGHAPFPFRTLARAGVNVCLGTDSLATVRKPPRAQVELNLFAEMRAFAAAHPHTAPETLLRMVTVNPARALGLAGRLGQFKPGAWADAIALPFEGPLRDALEAAVHHTGPVGASLIAGRWALPPGGLKR